jgi:hypothetical protein
MSGRLRALAETIATSTGLDPTASARTCASFLRAASLACLLTAGGAFFADGAPLSSFTFFPRPMHTTPRDTAPERFRSEGLTATAAHE